MSKYLDMIEIVELITSRMRDGEEGNDRLINTLNDQTNELNKRFRTINDKDAKIQALEGILNEKSDVIDAINREVRRLNGIIKERNAEAKSYRDLYNELNKMLDNEGYDMCGADAKNKITALLGDRDMYSNDAEAWSAKATKLNSEKRKLMELVQELKRAGVHGMAAANAMLYAYQQWLKQQAKKRGK